ncbi:MAG TPA: hypothetical protein VKX17_24980 [Planctomycetota bacterium]|nr:hypothetical protein [Planctomycetota bacterium]
MSQSQSAQSVAINEDSPDYIKKVFAESAAEWKRERGNSSSAARMALHPAYKRIIRLGRPVLPLILAELEREPDHWFVALMEITGDNPVPPEARGNLKLMAKAWLEWGRARGI